MPADIDCSTLPSPTLFLTSCFTVSATVGSGQHGRPLKPKDVN